MSGRRTAAEANARADELEMRVELLEDRLRAMLRALADVNEYAGLPSEPFRKAAGEMTPPPPTKAERMEALGLSVVNGGAA